MLHVCCIRAGEAFSPAYVLHLKDMVTRNLEEGFAGRFVCFTDRPDELPEDIETAPLPADLPGWWSKLALFREGLFPEGDRVLFLDLDTVITGAIDAVAGWDGEGLAILRDFYRPHGLQSSVMAWRAGGHYEIWDTFREAGCPMIDPAGDQRWIEQNVSVADIVLWQSLLPGTFVSFKQTRGIPSEASVVVFHGHPRPHEITDGWVPKVWTVGGLSHAELKAVCNTASEALFANVRSACARDLRWFDAENAEHDRHVAIVGGGPSVREMIEEIRWRKSVGQDVWVLNNVAAIGLVPHIDAQVLLDARPENAEFITVADEYLVASQCAPELFDRLGCRNITLWHVNMPGMADLLKDEKARVTYLIGGGTTVGMNALALAVSRGYRQIHLYGFDSSYRDGEHHAYPQALNDKDIRSDVLYGDKGYVCAPWMVGQAQEFMELAPAYEADGVTITVHGTGLLPDIARDLAQHMTPAEIRAHEILTRVPAGSCGVEIGVFAGHLSRALLNADCRLRLTMVDSWEGEGAAYRKPSGDWHAELSDQTQEGFFRQAVKRVAFAGDRARIMRQRSDVARYYVADRSCDFVFIDADHSYEGCSADIEGWLSKVKPGGFIGGHDYQNYDFPQFGVTRAVDEFVSRQGLTLETGGNFCWFVQLPMEKQNAA
jgi:hypothetical protein